MDSIKTGCLIWEIEKKNAVISLHLTLSVCVRRLKRKKAKNMSKIYLITDLILCF